MQPAIAASVKVVKVVPVVQVDNKARAIRVDKARMV